MFPVLQCLSHFPSDIEPRTHLPVDIIIHNYAFRQMRPSGCKMKLTSNSKKQKKYFVLGLILTFIVQHLLLFILVYLCKHSKKGNTWVCRNQNTECMYIGMYCYWSYNEFTWLAPHRLQMEASQIQPLQPLLQEVCQNLP